MRGDRDALQGRVDKLEAERSGLWQKVYEDQTRRSEAERELARIKKERG